MVRKVFVYILKYSMLMIVFSASLPIVAQQNALDAEVEDEAAMLAEFEANFS